MLNEHVVLIIGLFLIVTHTGYLLQLRLSRRDSSQDWIWYLFLLFNLVVSSYHLATGDSRILSTIMPNAFSVMMVVVSATLGGWLLHEGDRNGQGRVIDLISQYFTPKLYEILVLTIVFIAAWFIHPLWAFIIGGVLLRNYDDPYATIILIVATMLGSAAADILFKVIGIGGVLLLALLTHEQDTPSTKQVQKLTLTKHFVLSLMYVLIIIFSVIGHLIYGIIVGGAMIFIAYITDRRIWIQLKRGYISGMTAMMFVMAVNLLGVDALHPNKYWVAIGLITPLFSIQGISLCAVSPAYYLMWREWLSKSWRLLLFIILLIIFF